MSQIRFTCQSLVGTGKKGIIPRDEFGYYDMNIGALNILNSAGEYYDYNGAKELFEGSSSFMRKIKRGALRGECGHPRREAGMTESAFMARILDTYEPNVCVHYSEVYLDFDNFKNPDGTPIVAIRAKLKPSGPKAQFLQEAIDNPKENVCFSIRSFTENTYHRGRLNKVLKTIITFDYVNEPGIHIAEKYKSPTLENYADMAVTPEVINKAYDQRQVLHLSQESSAISKDELFKLFGWKVENKSKLNEW